MEHFVYKFKKRKIIYLRYKITVNFSTVLFFISLSFFSIFYCRKIWVNVSRCVLLTMLLKGFLLLQRKCLMHFFLFSMVNCLFKSFNVFLLHPLFTVINYLTRKKQFCNNWHTVKQLYDKLNCLCGWINYFYLFVVEVLKALKVVKKVSFMKIWLFYYIF